MKNSFLFLLFFLLALPLMAVETTIKGGRMELLKKGEVVLFQDGVTLKRGPDRLRAKEMETTKRRDKVTARGKVKFFRKISENEELIGTGKKGYYDTTLGKGFLQGGFKRAHLIYKEIISSTQTRKMDLFAKKINFQKEKTNAVARDKVYGYTTDLKTGEFYEFWADEAEYFGDEKKVVLTGKKRPKVHQTKGPDQKRISGETIIYYIDERRFIADGDAEAIFIEDKSKKESEDQK